MTTYADLLYEAAEMLDDQAAQTQNGLGGMHDDDADALRQQAERIREALRTSSSSSALSTEDVERIKKYYDPSGSLYRDIEALSQSHEALRREKDTATSIAERYRDDKHQWYKPADTVQYQLQREPMTQDQIDWFEARK